MNRRKHGLARCGTVCLAAADAMSAHTAYCEARSVPRIPCTLRHASNTRDSLYGFGGHHLVVQRQGVLGHKGVGADALVVDKVQQWHHHPLVLLLGVGKHKSVRRSLQGQQGVFSTSGCLCTAFIEKQPIAGILNGCGELHRSQPEDSSASPLCLQWKYGILSHWESHSSPVWHSASTARR